MLLTDGVHIVLFCVKHVPDQQVCRVLHVFCMCFFTLHICLVLHRLCMCLFCFSHVCIVLCLSGSFCTGKYAFQIYIYMCFIRAGLVPDQQVCLSDIYIYNIAVLIIICRFKSTLLKYANPCQNWTFKRFARAAQKKGHNGTNKNLTLAGSRTQVPGFSSADAIATS